MENNAIQTLITETMQTLRGFIMTQNEQIEIIQEKISKLDTIEQGVQDLKKSNCCLENSINNLTNRVTKIEESNRFYEQFFDKLEHKDTQIISEQKDSDKRITELALKYSGIAAVLGLILEKIIPLLMK